MKIASLYYTEESFCTIIEQDNKMIEREKTMQESSELKVETQEKRYLNFLEN